MSNSIWAGKKTDTEAKLVWCRNSVITENSFVDMIAPLAGLDLIMHPDKATCPYGPDLLLNGKQYADLKSQTTPFFTSKRYGLDPQHAVTFNLKDYKRYKNLYPDIMIYFWVRWDELVYPVDEEIFVEPMEGVWGIHFSEIMAINVRREMPIHEYQKRIGDTDGNARTSFLISLTRMTKIWEPN